MPRKPFITKKVEVGVRGNQPKKRNAYVKNCTLGLEVLEKLDMRSDVKVGTLYDKYRVDSWNRVLEKVLGYSPGS
jgi:hypothetical protein